MPNTQALRAGGVAVDPVHPMSAVALPAGCTAWLTLIRVISGKEHSSFRSMLSVNLSINPPAFTRSTLCS
jgi:hypothetical protein